MALQVWLPLNKDFRNTGLLSNLPSESYSNSALSDDGFYGKSYLCNTTYHFTNDFLQTNTWTIACWFYRNGDFGQWNDIILCKNNSGSEDAQFYLSCVYCGQTLNIGVNGSGSISYTANLSKQTWYHAAATYNGSTIKLYLNGELVKEGTKTYNRTDTLNLGIGNRSTNSDGTAATGGRCYLLNDVRIYDNTLTEKDVKRIYQQKLFEFYPKENRKNYLSYANVYNENNWQSYGFGSKGIGTVSDDFVAVATTNRLNIRNGNTDNVIKITTKYSGDTTSPAEIARGVTCAQIADNECVTFSFYAKGEGTSVGRVIRSHIYCAKAGETSTVLSTGTYYRLTSEWKRYSHTFKWNKGGTTTGNYNCYVVPYLAKNEYLYVCNFQFEEGSGATTYNNSNARDLIFDKSGFLIKNDLVCSGVTFSGNSAVFNGTSDIIRSKTAGLNISGGTLSIWFLPRTKPSGNGTVMFLDGNSRMSVGLYNNAVSFIVSTKTSSQLFPASSVIYGSWNHICVLYGEDRVAYDCYLNGVKLAPSSSTINWSETESVMKIGARENYNSYFDGAIKNIKIFKKQLSEEEILELYRQNGN